MSIKLFFESIRIKQWIKNLFIFGPLVFSTNIRNYPLLINTVFAFFLFSLAASTVYLLNDLLDYEKDRKHPTKRNRPIASGRLSRNLAKIMILCLGTLSLLFSFMLGFYFGMVVLVYLIMNVAYSVRLKHVVIIDVMIISFGFVLRVVSGALVIHVVISLWLLVCTTLLALFLALSKRRQEIVLLEKKAASHRKILQEYSLYLLDQMISVVTASTLMAYLLYTMDPHTISKFGSPYIILTFPFVLYGIFRYLYLVHQKSEGGNPTRVLLTDTPLLVNTLLWIASFEIIINIPLRFHYY